MFTDVGTISFGSLGAAFFSAGRHTFEEEKIAQARRLHTKLCFIRVLSCGFMVSCLDLARAKVSCFS